VVSRHEIVKRFSGGKIQRLTAHLRSFGGLIEYPMYGVSEQVGQEPQDDADSPTKIILAQRALMPLLQSPTQRLARLGAVRQGFPM